MLFLSPGTGLSSSRKLLSHRLLPGVCMILTPKPGGEKLVQRPEAGKGLLIPGRWLRFRII